MRTKRPHVTFDLKQLIHVLTIKISSTVINNIQICLIRYKAISSNKFKIKKNQNIRNDNLLKIFYLGWHFEAVASTIRWHLNTFMLCIVPVSFVIYANFISDQQTILVFYLETTVADKTENSIKDDY